MQVMNRRREPGGKTIRAIDDATAEAVLEHGPTILRTARRYSVCSADAEDAYQRGVEILLTKAPTSDTDQLVPWLVTVVKNEALAILKQRQRVDGAAFENGAETMASGDRLPSDRAEDYELIAHGAEALGRLKRDEVRALLLKADGLSYKEIAAHTGWSYTKVNRCMTEGRAAFRARLSAIQIGKECERLQAAISQFADGELTGEDGDDLAIHLQNCLACKSTLREYRAAPARVAALFPLPLVPAFAGESDRVADGLQLVWQWVQERIGAATVHAHQWGEVAGAKKVATVAAAAAVATGGVAVEQKFSEEPQRKAPVVQPAQTQAPSSAVTPPRVEKPRKRRDASAEPEPTSVPQTQPATAEPEEPQPEPQPAPAVEDQGTADLAP